MSPRFSMICISGALALGACENEQPVQEPAPRTVETLTIGTTYSNSIRTYPGLVRARERSSLSFEAPGIILSLDVDLGDRFADGQILGRVDNRQARLALEAAKAQRLEAVAERDDAQIDFNRRSALRGSGAIAPATIDAAKARLDRANARVAAAEASVATARERLSDTQLIAPFNGEVVARLREPSEVVAVGQPVFQVVGNGTALEIVTELPLDALQSIELDDVLEVNTSDGERLPATVIEIGKDAGSAGLYPVTLSAGETSLRPGERVSVQLSTNNDTERLLIPLTSYVPASNPGEVVVFVIDESTSQVESRTIQIGTVTDDGASIISGLRPGDRIAARGVTLLRDGETVQTANSAVVRYNP